MRAGENKNVACVSEVPQKMDTARCYKFLILPGMKKCIIFKR
jgi:hypothetical protein